MQFPFEQWKDPVGQALARHMNGSRLSQVVSSHDWFSSLMATSTHSPEVGSGCLSDQNPVYKEKRLLVGIQTRKNILFLPEYCDTSVPAADSKVLVLRSSKEARPNQ